MALSFSPDVLTSRSSSPTARPKALAWLAVTWVATALCLLDARSGAAQPVASSTVPSGGAVAAEGARRPVVLGVQPGELVMLSAAPDGSGSIRVMIGSQAPSCRAAEDVFELPIQIDETGFQLKHAIRPLQQREADGSCTEAIVISYLPQHYWPLKRASAVTLHLPWGRLPLNDAAVAHLHAVTPSRPAEDLPADSSAYAKVLDQLTRMLASGQVVRAREDAEGLLPVFATRPPEEAFGFFALLGMARRMTGDLSFAASCYEVAIILAGMTKGRPNVGVVHDNLASVRRLQGRFVEAEHASDRAIASLETIDDPEARQALARVYNNRAMMLLEQGRHEPALAYSEKALAILKVTLQPTELEPFFEDNRRIREGLGR